MRVTRETIVVAGENKTLDEVLGEFGCGVIRTNVEEVAKAIRRFMQEFEQGIPVVIIYGQSPDQASALAAVIKGVCEGTKVIAVSCVVGHMTVDADRDYDVIIPENSGNLRDAVGAFLGL